jgi:hypothetical protein
MMHVPQLAVALAFALVASWASPRAAPVDRPTPVISAVPMIVAAPGKIVFHVALRGGADDDEEFYCPTVEWDWDDGSVSERSRDCDPYEKGKSKIERNFTAEHEFKVPDEYRVTFRLKKRTRILTAANLTVTVTGAGPDGTGPGPEPDRRPAPRVAAAGCAGRAAPGGAEPARPGPPGRAGLIGLRTARRARP